MDINTITYIIIGITIIITFKGFNDQKFFDRYKFSVDGILRRKQWDRMFLSAFLHGDHMHLIFNMLTLYFFAAPIILFTSNIYFVIIYITSIIGGSLLSLFMYRKNSSYTAIGASAGVTGILFASIAFSPKVLIYVFFILPIPGFIFGILYLAYSVYGMRSQLGNIGHAAHLGGAVVGLSLAIIEMPDGLFAHNSFFIGVMALPMIVLGYYVYKER